MQAQGGGNLSLFVGGRDDDDDDVAGGGRLQRKSESTNLKFLPIIGLMVVTLVLAGLAPQGAYSYLPFLLLASKVGKPRNGGEAALGLVLGVIWNVWAALVAQALTLGQLPVAGGALLPYCALLSVFLRRDISDAGPHGYVLIRTVVDPPLLAMVALVDRCGGQFLHDGEGAFLSVLDDRLAMSSMPLASNVEEMQANNIRSVVNMCLEYGGPTAAYEEAGIAQLRLPTLDTNEPSFQSLKAGVEFIDARLQQEPGSRVLIHCKGGRGRAAAMALAYYISQGHAPAEAMRIMKSKRSVVEPVVASYPAVQEYLRYTQQQQGAGGESNIPVGTPQ